MNFSYPVAGVVSGIGEHMYQRAQYSDLPKTLNFGPIFVRSLATVLFSLHYVRNVKN
jgi:hypothetical protein